MYSRSKMYRKGMRIFIWALLALSGWLHAEALAQSGVQPEKLLILWAGSLPIILSAPHGGRQAIPGVPLRQGVGVAQFKAERDNNTAELAEAIATKLGTRLAGKPFLIVALFERKYIDVNRPHNGAYETGSAWAYYTAFHSGIDDACKKVRSLWGRGLLLDIHGQGAEAEVIFRGTGNGRSVAGLLQRFGHEALRGPNSIFGQLALRGYRSLPDVGGNEGETRYTGGYTTRTYGSHRGTGIDAIQLEFGTKLRARANLDKTAADLADAIAVFAKEYLPASRTIIKPRVEAQP